MGIVRNQSIKNSISFYIGMAIGAINTVIIYPNVFNDHPEHFGLIQIIVAYAIVISTFSSLGIPKTFIRFFPAIKQKGQLYFLSLITPLFGFVIMSGCYLFLKDEILHLIQASDLLQENFYYIIILVFFISFYDVLTAISRSFLRAATPIFINEVFLKLYSLIVLLLHWFDYFDFPTFLQIYIAGYILKFCILLIIQAYKKRLSINLSLQGLRLKEMLSFGTYVLLGGASIMIVTRLDMIMIGTMMDLEHVAFYTVAFFIGNVIKIPGKSIASISEPLLAKAWEDQDFKQIQTLYSKSSINQLIIGGVFFLCIWINIDEVFSLLPLKFSFGKWVVLFIGLSQLFNISSGVNGAIIVNSRYYRYDLYTNVLLVFITLLINYIFIPIYGINGAAMATALSVFLFNFIRLVLIKVKMKMHPFSIKTIYTVIILFAIYSLVTFLPLSGNVYFDIFWKSIFVIIVFTPLMLVFKLSEDINKIIVDVRKIFGI
jgi:O-antigen/teichoic acid export membrane protein